MNYLLFVVLFVVALITQLFTFRLEQVACLRCMWVVAAGAFSFFQRCVHHRFFKSQGLSFMAGVAHLIPWLFEEKPGNDAVSQVAFLAFVLLDRSVYISHPEVGVGKLGVTVETLLADKDSPFGRGSTGRKVNSRKQEKRDSYGKEYSASLRGDQFVSHYGFILLNVVYGDFCVVGQLHDPYGIVEWWNNG